MSINKAFILGNLGQDPEMRYTQTGTPVATLSIATGKKFKTRSGEMKEETQWHRVVLFNRSAEIAGEYLRKGSQVHIEGEITYRQWQDDSGATRYTTEIRCDRLTLVGKSEGNGGFAPRRDSAGAAPPAAASPAPAAQVPADGGFEDDDIPF